MGYVDVSPGRSGVEMGMKKKIPSQGWPWHVQKMSLTSEDWSDQETTGDKFIKEPRKMLMKDFQLQDKFLFLF